MEATNVMSKEINTYVIEREIPDAGKLNPEQIKGISQTSCNVLKELGPEITWKHSYITGNKVYCVYTAPNKEMIYEHANKAGFPANSVSELVRIINPKTAE